MSNRNFTFIRLLLAHDYVAPDNNAQIPLQWQGNVHAQTRFNIAQIFEP